jgi:dienelactone hydrolase
VPDAKYLSPFVLPVATVEPQRQGAVDLYLPEAGEPRPAVVFVHGLLTRDMQPTPRDWPVYRGYGSLAAKHGMVGVTVDHRLYDLADCPLVADDLAAAVEVARADPRVDPDRVAIWCFSGSGLLLADWLREPPGWLRCVAATYPMLAAPGHPIDPRFLPAEAVASAGDLPIVLTRAGRERPVIAETVEAFVAAAKDCGARLDIVDVPNGQHAFDTLDHTDESRDAVQRAMDKVVAALNEQALEVAGTDQ